MGKLPEKKALSGLEKAPNQKGDAESLGNPKQTSHGMMRVNGNY
jgi:hypothetical protein